MEINEIFLKRMREMLGEEYPRFLSALTEGDAVRGARVSLIKRPSGEMPEIDGFTSRKISYVDNGYILDGDGQVGRSAAHHAGMIYMQDPGAMSVMSALDIEPNWWVADLCSAPGGKSSQIAERLGDGGFLLSNEYVPKRAKIIVSNFERLGISRAIVTSLDVAEIKKLYTEVFDLVVVDAPCSGEGMMRKSEEAREEWTPDSPAICRERQLDILRNAYSILKPGGKLVYSTCTWAIEENEEVVSTLIREFPDLKIIPVKETLRVGTADGIPYGGDERLRMTRRCYPHITEGEGQYVALLEKSENCDIMTTIHYKDSIKPLSKEEEKAVSDFIRSALISMPRARLGKHGDNIILIPHNCPIPPRSVFMGGVLLGEVRRGILYPSHHFFSAYGELFKLKVDLDDSDERLTSYLRGEEISTDMVESGWCSVRYCGSSLGGGKISGGRVKNHYPKGLRNN